MRWTISLLVFHLLAQSIPAADWPQWLGTQRNSDSPEKVEPWAKAPKVLWRHPIGEGHSSPIVAAGKVFLHAKVNGMNEEELVALDAQTGKQLWSPSQAGRLTYPRAPFNSPFGNGPRATPAFASGRLYALGVTGVLTCFDADNGKTIWQIDTLAKFKTPNLTFGISGSPLVEGNRVIVPVGKGTSVAAFNKDDGDVLWKSLDDPASYSSPVILQQHDSKQIVTLTQQGVVSLKPDDGALFWKFPLVDLLSESSTTPVRSGDMLLASSVTYGSVGLRLEMKDGKPAVTRAWKNPALTCYFSTPVVAATDQVYMVTGTIIPPPEATLRCVDIKTGKEYWHKNKIGKYHAAIIHTANDKLLVLDDGGSLVLLEPNAKEYRELARSKVCGPTWAHPALSDGRLYIRDEKEVLCLRLGQD